MSKSEPRKARKALRARERKKNTDRQDAGFKQCFFFRALSRLSRFQFFLFVAVASASAQAPMLQDGATALRQTRLDGTLGQAPQGPSSLPSFEVGWGGADGEGIYTPLTQGEGLGQGTQGWGLGVQGRYVRGGWSFAATMLALRDHGRTQGSLQRAAFAYQGDSGWRMALEQAPLAWGSGLNGGDLMGDAARPFPRLSFSTSEADLSLGRFRADAFIGRLERDPPIPEWMTDRGARLAAQSAGLGLQRPLLWGGLLHGSFGPLVDASFGAVTLGRGQDAQGHAAPPEAARTLSLVELKLRLPRLATGLKAQGASLLVSRSGAPESGALTLAPARDLGALQVVWEGWDLALEYAGSTRRVPTGSITEPTYLAGFSTHGDPLGPAFGRDALTRTVELSLPLFLEGRGRLKVIHGSALMDQPRDTTFWFLQGDAQWRTSTGRVGASLASRRDLWPSSPARWGWSCSVFQAFRVF